METLPQNSDVVVQIETIWAIPAKRDKWWKFWQRNVSLDELMKEMERIGNQVVVVDRENNRLGLAVGNEGE